MSTLTNKLGTGSGPRLYLVQGGSDPPAPNPPPTIDYGKPHDVPTAKYTTWNVRDGAGPQAGNYYGTISLNDKGQYVKYDKPAVKSGDDHPEYYLDAVEHTDGNEVIVSCKIENIHTPPPPIIPNEWSGGQGNKDSKPTKDKMFWVKDYGDEPKRWAASEDGAIYQSTKKLSEPPKGQPANFGSRAYPICIHAADPQWTLSAGIGDEFYGLWQIDIKIGSNGRGPFCETFYLSERFNCAYGPEHYNDGAPPDNDHPNKICSREIDIMETRWPEDLKKGIFSEGPQINLPNGNNTGWDSSWTAGKPMGKWERVGGAPTPNFVTFGCLIRKAGKTGEKDKLWLYAYEPDGLQWYCTDAIEKNSTYDQKYPFVPYIGTWCDPNHKEEGQFATGYKNFIYLRQGDPKIEGKNPKDNPEAFGLALIHQSWQRIAGWLSHISVAADGTVYGVNGKEGKMYRFVGGTAGWVSGPKARSVPGGLGPSDFSVVSVGSATNIWIQDKGGNTYRYLENAWGPGDGGWSPVPGPMHSICVASDGTVCGLHINYGRVYKYLEPSGWTLSFGQKAFKVLAVGSKEHIWGLEADGSIYRWGGGEKWDQVPGNLSHISVAADGTVYGTVGVKDNQYLICKYTGLGENPWAPVPGGLKVVAAGSAHNIWGLDKDGRIERYIV